MIQIPQKFSPHYSLQTYVTTSIPEVSLTWISQTYKTQISQRYSLQQLSTFLRNRNIPKAYRTFRQFRILNLKTHGSRLQQIRRYLYACFKETPQNTLRVTFVVGIQQQIFYNCGHVNKPQNVSRHCSGGTNEPRFCCFHTPVLSSAVAMQTQDRVSAQGDPHTTPLPQYDNYVS